MKITGILAEYNPFHNGHQYHIQQTRQATGADYILVIMNGDFTQRGLPAGWNKYDRAAMAVSNGADAVLELPTLYGTASAEFFALGGIRLLNQLGAVTHLSFGCETDQLPLLQAIADLLTQEPEAYRKALNQLLSQGCSFPKARAAALQEVLSVSSGLLAEADEINRLLASPNTILALEYLKALKQEGSPIQPTPCRRSDDGYHHSELKTPFSSATAIRNEYYRHGCTPALGQTLPASVWTMLAEEYKTRSPIDIEDFYPYLQYSLWEPKYNLSDYLDVSEALANRIRTRFQPEYTYRELVEAIIHKQYTYTRIQRSLLHILLGIRTVDMKEQLASGTMHYARLLAFRKEASPLLRELSRTSSIPIINHVADGIRLLRNQGDSLGLHLLQQDISAAHLYEQAVAHRYHTTAVNEYTRGIIIC